MILIIASLEAWVSPGLGGPMAGSSRQLRRFVIAGVSCDLASEALGAWLCAPKAWLARPWAFGRRSARVRCLAVEPLVTEMSEAFRRCVHEYHPEEPSNEDFDEGSGPLAWPLPYGQRPRALGARALGVAVDSALTALTQLGLRSAAAGFLSVDVPWESAARNSD
eukprot:s3725_g2.t1